MSNKITIKKLPLCTNQYTCDDASIVIIPAVSAFNPHI